LFSLGNCLRIVERGGDEIVEIDVLDIEVLAHMTAARAQELGDLLLVAGDVELCLHRIGRGRHLTERECGRKDFDEDGFHGIGSSCINMKMPPEEARFRSVRRVGPSQGNAAEDRLRNIMNICRCGDIPKGTH
jgi:hypothetical protein